MKYEEEVDMSFRKDERKPVYTVGELVKELHQLPANMPLETGFGDAVKVVVPIVHDYSGEHLAARIDDCDDEGW